MSDVTESGRTGISLGDTPTDSLRIAKDFPDPPAAPTAPVEAKVEEPTPPPPPTKFVREIDLKDGSGVQKFEADTWEGLVDKLATAQENATRKIRELSKRPKVEPERPEQKEVSLSPAEILALKESAAADPLAAFNKMFELQMGMTVNDFKAQQQSQKDARAEQQFLQEHKADFFPCPENAQAINAFLERNKYPKTVRNLEYAYQQLESELKKAPAAPVPVVTTPADMPPPPEPPKVRVQEIPPPPVTISARFGERVESTPVDGGVSAAEAAEIAKLPPDQMKARIEQLYRQGRSMAR